MAEKSICVERMENIVSLFGSFDENIKLVENRYGVNIISRGNEVRIIGDEEQTSLAVRAVKGMLLLADKGETLTEQNIRYVFSLVDEGSEDRLDALADGCVCVTSRGKAVRPKTLGQKKYVELIRDDTVIIGVGPAGTGKTYLAVAMAVQALRRDEVSRIILTRPAVEAGEKLGFLPGDLQNKVDPYLRPLYDALFDMLGADVYQKYIERGIIEIAPLAYMRGRTLENSFIILDEAQNTTPEQMKMFLTRLGFGSKAVITGDISQIDLPEKNRSGLVQIIKILNGVEDIAIMEFSHKDVVRHELVGRIIKAYEKYEQEEERKKNAALKRENGKRKGVYSK